MVQRKLELELTRKMKQTYNKIMIWNQVQENLTKSQNIFFKLPKRKSEEETNSNVRSSSERLNVTRTRYCQY